VSHAPERLILGTAVTTPPLEDAASSAGAAEATGDSTATRAAGPDGRKIIHIDMDAFYASVEQRDNPELRGRPVAVGGSKQRGVVAAASYEARAFGVRSAMPSMVALRNCPELVFVKPRFDVYKEVSRQIRAIFTDYTPLVEPLSLDEAYLDVTCNLKNMPSATLIAQEIRARIRAETGLTASAGVSYNKFLAKLASDHRKPDGLTVIRPEQGAAFVEALPVGKFHGIGPVTAARMNQLGIYDGAALRAQTREFLREHFGKSADYYYWMARGVDHRAVEPDRPRKSIGSETTFDRDLGTHEELVAGIRPAIESVWGHCEKNGISGRTVTLKIRYADFQRITRSHTAPAPITSRDTLEQVSLALVASLFPLAKSVRLAGLSLSNFDSPREVPRAQLELAL
jgi:DNA polymerase-4